MERLNLIAKWSWSKRVHSQQSPTEHNDFHELSQIPEFPEMLCTAAAGGAAAVGAAAAVVLLNCVFSLMS